VRFFLDRDLGKRLGRALREVGVEVQLHAERYPGIGDTPDEVWIPEVAADGWIILTHDKKIRFREAERQAFAAAGARAFVFVTQQPTPFVHLRALMIAWERIRAIDETTLAPYMFGLLADGRLNQYVPRP
jgi:hypothetical protein